MAFRKIIDVEGESFIASPNGNVSLGQQKLSVSAYCKIIYVAGDKQMLQINVESVAEQFKKTEVFFFKPSVDDNASNFVKQAYEYLKTLPEWANATDC
jgi:threonine synthase